MRSLQRVLALLLAAVLTFGLIPAQTPQVWAAEAVNGTDGDVDVPITGGEETDPTEDTDTTAETSVLTVTPARSEVYPGDQLTLTVSLSGGNAWTSLGYIPLTDSAAFAVTGGEVLPAGQAAELWDFTAADGGLLYCSDPAAIEGDLFRFTVRVRDDAPAGEYTVTSAAAVSCGSTGVAFTLNDATVTVLAEPVYRCHYCEHCAQEVVWEPYSGVLSGADAHYYLEGDYASPKQVTVGSTTGQHDVVLDLNGHTLTAANRAFLVYGTLSILDTVGSGQIIAGSGGAIYVYQAAAMNIYGGVISGIYAASSACIALSGAPVISGTGIELADGAKLTLGELADGAHILVSAKGIFTETNEKAADYLGYFVPAQSADSIRVQNNALVYCEYEPDFTSGLLFDSNTANAVCPVCEKKVTWTALDGDVSVNLTGGHYCLSEDIAFSGADAALLTFQGTEQAVCIHLNGHSITTENVGAFYGNSGTVNLVGAGTVSGDVVIAKDSTFNMYEGTIFGGTVTVSGGVFNMYGGAVIGGTAGYGGNIFAENDASVNLGGGTVAGGTAELGGGNICLMDGAALIIDGCTVSGGTAELGGNIAAYSGSRFAVLAGTVTGGTAGDGGNIYAVGSAGSATFFGMGGGNVSGDIAIGTYCTAYLEGAPVVTKGTASGLSLTEGVLIILGELTEGASVAVNAAGVFTEASDSAADYGAYFTSADNAYEIIVRDNALCCERRSLETEFAIVTQPADVEITAGFTAQFAVEATNAASYKWQYRRNETAPWVNTKLTGYATDTLSVPAILGRDGYQYRCRVTGNDGKVLYTEPATLTVNDSIFITAQPTRQIVCVDADATFTVTADGAGLTYQWQYRKNSDGNWMVTGMTGNKTDTLTVPALLSRNGYQYRCAITDGNGIKIYSNAATLSAIGFTVQPADQTAAVNTNAVFSVAAEGQELTYQWQYRKTADGNWMNTGLSGNKTDTLTVPALASRDGYQYRCAITDALGIIRYSDPATLTVE